MEAVYDIYIYMREKRTALEKLGREIDRILGIEDKAFCNIRYQIEGDSMKLKIIIHKAEEGGFWAEVPAIPGCVSQGETMEELLENIHEAAQGCLMVDVQDIPVTPADQVMEIAL